MNYYLKLFTKLSLISFKKYFRNKLSQIFKPSFELTLFFLYLDSSLPTGSFLSGKQMKINDTNSEWQLYGKIISRIFFVRLELNSCVHNVHTESRLSIFNWL